MGSGEPETATSARSFRWLAGMEFWISFMPYLLMTLPLSLGDVLLQEVLSVSNC
jgi:hypothetical protein